MNPNPSIHPDTLIGGVTLAVADLDRQIEFYQNELGLRLRWRDGNKVSMGTNSADLVILNQHPAYKRYRGVTGLYHFAILLPSRLELARAIARLFELGVVNYPTDHIMTKTTYLEDAEGNGIELYCESPEDGSFLIENDDFVTRRTDGSLSSGREPLDLEALFATLPADADINQPMPDSTRVGHIHLYTPSVSKAVEFYHGVLGFDLQGVSSIFKAAFVSAGGYHHHFGLNAWKGDGAPPPPADALGLEQFSILLPNQTAIQEVVTRLNAAGVTVTAAESAQRFSDPFGNTILLQTKP